MTLIDEEDREHGVRPMPATDLDIRWTILFHCPFFHSTVAYRRHLFDAAGGYRDHELISQDHYLWHEMLPLTRAANLPEPLTRYRMNSQGLTAGGEAHDPRGRTHAIREQEWARLGLDLRPVRRPPGPGDLGLPAGRGHPGREPADAGVPVHAVGPAPRSARGVRRRAPLRERADRRRLAERVMAAMVAEPPARPDRRRRLAELCLAADRRAARAAGVERLSQQ